MAGKHKGLGSAMYRPQAFGLRFQLPNVLGDGNLSGFLKRLFQRFDFVLLLVYFSLTHFDFLLKSFDFLGHGVFLCLTRPIHWIYFF